LASEFTCGAKKRGSLDSQPVFFGVFFPNDLETARNGMHGLSRRASSLKRLPRQEIRIPVSFLPQNMLFLSAHSRKWMDTAIRLFSEETDGSLDGETGLADTEPAGSEGDSCKTETVSRIPPQNDLKSLSRNKS